MFDFDPADHLQVPRGYTEQRAFSSQMTEHIFDARHTHQVHLLTPFGDRSAHGLQDGFDFCFEQIGWNASLEARLAQNGGISVAVEQDAGQRDLESGNALHAGGEGFE